MGYKNIFLTGAIQVGKSTAISRFLVKYIPKSNIIAGFKTKSFYENGVLSGYYIESQMNTMISNISENIVGINAKGEGKKCCLGIPEVFEKKGVEILSESLKVPNSFILMDELGFFEKDALQFIKQVHKTLDSTHMVLGVLKEKENDFLKSISIREDVKVIRVTLENREEIVNEINKYYEE
ncbi:nucleoside-triphosphatase [Clostridium sp.]|uniref:nucleoside-triphosphatase n=1 Tax=Clostridium sp. TaxID=1506 RepID=UPI003D6D031D